MKSGGRGGGADQRGDEDCGREEEADGQFFGEAAGGAAGVWPGVDGEWLGVDEQHPGGEECGQKDVEVEGSGVDAVEESGEGDGAEDDGGEESGAVVVVEAVAGFEIGVVVMRVEQAGV
jgi:hypothetical protein